jgi:Domain of unknown function (DUF1841)
MTLPTHSRDQLRRSYAEAWAKRVAGTPLSALEALISDVIALHPEYQGVVADAERAVGFTAPAAETQNPFLHMGLHIAVREQVAIDRPPGVRDLHQRLTHATGSIHNAEHVLMDALGQTLWEAQRAGKEPDERHYLALAQQRLKG